MKIWPMKPHFFKPILPGNDDGVSIPDSFFKYIVGEMGPEALLRRGDKEWRVKINGQFLTEGWSRFAKENSLKPGDFVIFGHEGNMVFDVLIFDRSQCEKEDPACEDDGENVAADPTETKESPSSEFMSEANGDSSVGSGDGVSSTPNVKTEESDNPHFSSTVKAYSISGSYYLCLPVNFARSNGLMYRRCEITLEDEQERSWYLGLTTYGTSVRLKRGSTLGEFFTANGFKEGDSFKVELVENGEAPVVRILRLKDDTNVSEPPNSRDKGKRVEASHPYFTSTIKPYSAKYASLYLPTPFARRNGLLEKDKLILIDKRQRRWSLRLHYTHQGGHFSVGGWRKYYKENGLKVGDDYKFELIENGKVPVALITVLPPGGVQSPVDSE